MGCATIFCTNTEALHGTRVLLLSRFWAALQSCRPGTTEEQPMALGHSDAGAGYGARYRNDLPARSYWILCPWIHEHGDRGASLLHGGVHPAIVINNDIGTIHV